jgi:hypothetical protein
LLEPKIVNVLNVLAKKHQAEAAKRLKAMMYATSRPATGERTTRNSTGSIFAPPTSWSHPSTRCD